MKLKLLLSSLTLSASLYGQEGNVATINEIKATLHYLVKDYYLIKEKLDKKNQTIKQLRLTANRNETRITNLYESLSRSIKTQNNLKEELYKTTNSINKLSESFNAQDKIVNKKQITVETPESKKKGSKSDLVNTKFLNGIDDEVINNYLREKSSK